MDEQTISAQEKLKQLDAERKTLRAQVKDERTIRLEEAAKMRDGRDEKIEKIQERIKKILSVIFQYNKLGKVAKVDFDIFGKITAEISENLDEIPIESTTTSIFFLNASSSAKFP